MRDQIGIAIGVRWHDEHNLGRNIPEGVCFGKSTKKGRAWHQKRNPSEFLKQETKIEKEKGRWKRVRSRWEEENEVKREKEEKVPS